MKGRQEQKHEVVRNDKRTIARSYNHLTTRKREVEMSNSLADNDSYDLTTLTTKLRKGRREGVVERFAREGVGRKDERAAGLARRAAPAASRPGAGGAR